MSTFYERFVKRRSELKSLLCVGFDPDPDRLPGGYRSDNSGWLDFAQDITAAVANLAVAYKPNLAFFECLPRGWELLEDLIKLLRRTDPGALIIADAKRGDIGNTARAYARAFFETLDVDAVTVNPYMGLETLEPFCEYRDRGVIVLCLTSNPGALQYQARGNPPLYEQVARDVSEMNRTRGNLWLVAGATQSAESLGRLRELAPTTPFLIPGVGAQGGDVETVLRTAGADALVNASRFILYAADHKDQVRTAGRRNAEELVRVMREFL